MCSHWMKKHFTTFSTCGGKDWAMDIAHIKCALVFKKLLLVTILLYHILSNYSFHRNI